jgi:hypothetical protein
VVGNGPSFDLPWVNNNGSEVYNVPKRFTRGKNAGEATYMRREKLLLWALVPSEWLEDTKAIALSGPAYKEETLADAPTVTSADDEDVEVAENEEVLSEAFQVPE